MVCEYECEHERELINIFGYELNIIICDVINNDLIKISWYKNIQMF